MPSEGRRTALIKSEVVRAIKEFLVLYGFEVATDYRVDGVSGYNHRFDMFARRGELKVLIDIPEDVFGVLASVAKRVDVHGFDFLILARRDVIRGILPEVEVPEGGLLKRATIIVFDDIEDLLHRMREYVAARTG